ncbi:class A beta-lactamase-related serine hydrolase [Mucilaginibacter terrigena]|uniref:Class A beta-lactamase-related serine hydrolase n=1 Tax=Mucilaginibacter terrigena TaxID=2492395 RepID=A0A4Q5LPH7_9SPHI|nr:serine hydrolase domain-containing protein [Mucilaginibacter terrigena]RYU91295.1 class A beta-lactamase-related serine hydrolase [Mucilaginibacter terrigena]
MKHKNIAIAFFALIIALPAISLAQTSASDSINVFIKAKMQQRSIPALQIAVIRNGAIVKLSTYGTANLEYNIPATDQSLFNINSITKAFVGVAVMQLAEQGKLKISDPVSMYIDSLPTAWRNITLQQVLTHTSGLPDILDAEEQVLGHNDEAEAWKLVTALPVAYKPGEKFSYNQTGYVILGKIITKLSGVHFTKFIEDNQFKAAGMKLTRYGDSYDVIPNYAGAYTMTRQVGNNFVRNSKPGIAYIQFPVFFRTAAGILSTAGDMANWIIALKAGKLLKQKSSLDALWSPAILNNGKIGGFNALTNGYALGWPTVTRAEHPAVGPVGGGRSGLFVYLKDDLSIVVLTNLMGSNPERMIDEIAGYYIPEMHEANGFGLSPALKQLRLALLKQGFDKADAAAAGLKKKDATLNFNENELNAWGYQLISQKKAKDALAIFKLNTSLYPQSANAYDSLGEIQEMLEDNTAALASYKRSLALNSGNKNAADRIKALSAK